MTNQKHKEWTHLEVTVAESLPGYCAQSEGPKRQKESDFKTVMNSRDSK